MFSDLRIRWRALVRRRAVERELDDELRFHLEREIEKLRRAGVAPDEARRRAQLALGGMEQVKEECRDSRGMRFVDELAQDVHHALRLFRRAPAFTAVVLLTLAVGIGANTAIFSVVQAVLLRPLPYHQPDRLVMVWEHKSQHQSADGPSDFDARNVISPANFLVWQDENTVFQGLAAFLEQPANLSGIGEPQHIAVQYVTPNFLPVLGVSPLIGRSFTPDEGQPNRNRVAILSYGLWQQQFGGRADAIGRTVTLNETPYTVVGVMPHGFQLFVAHESIVPEAPALWVPFAWDASARQPKGRFAMAIARLKPGVSLAAAQGQMDGIAQKLAHTFRDFDTNWGVELVPLHQELTGKLRMALLVLLGAVAFVLLIACANVANLLLARTALREREVAVRTAVGAPRFRLVRQFLTESVLLALLGGALGIALASWSTSALVALSPAGLLDRVDVHLDGSILTFTLVLSLATGIIFGLIPAVSASMGSVQPALQEGSRGATAGRSRHRARSVLVVAEIGLALLLVTGAGLLVRSAIHLNRVDPGFDPAHLLTAQVLLTRPQNAKPAATIAFFHDLLDRLSTTSGVRGASGDASVSFTGVIRRTGFTIVNRPAPPRGQEWGTTVHVVLPNYFRTMGIGLLRGRTFNRAEETEMRHVVIVSETLAHRYFPHTDPIGQQIVIDMKDDNTPSTIIGVVADVHEDQIDQAPGAAVYWPFPELPTRVMTLAVRTAGDPMGILPAIRAEVRALDPDLPLAHVRTMDEWMSDSVGRTRFATVLLTVLAAIALLLAGVGVYSVMANTITERTHEIGLRVALGADWRAVLQLVFWRSARLTVIGIALGVAGALAVTRSLQSLLFEVTPSDPATLAAGAALLAAIALLACIIPAYRALRVDPAIALRRE